MTVPRLGERAPSFTLPAAQGGQVGLDDYVNRSAVIIWFTKGMACPFCRQQMSQISRAYSRIKEHNAEVLEISNSTLARGQLYARQFSLPFPYLCDPNRTARSAWGIDKRSHGPGYYVKTFMAASKMPPAPSDFGDIKPALKDIPGLLADEDMGFFIVDRAGIVRYALTGGYLNEHGSGPRQLPGPDEIVRELQRCSAAA